MNLFLPRKIAAIPAIISKIKDLRMLSGWMFFIFLARFSPI
jgi:hypothetical protein